ncbi:MAG: hypothetical protein Q9M91_08690 [Candidatus Dojkabacteria bacterium]|nr:hypothetical protein [Candidatus Dojkabacteria bacterium]
MSQVEISEIDYAGDFLSDTLVNPSYEALAEVAEMEIMPDVIVERDGNTIPFDTLKQMGVIALRQAKDLILISEQTQHLYTYRGDTVKVFNTSDSETLTAIEDCLDNPDSWKVFFRRTKEGKLNSIDFISDKEPLSIRLYLQYPPKSSKYKSNDYIYLMPSSVSIKIYEEREA